MKKKNNFLLILLSPFKYFCLGCFYTLYGCLYPFIIVYNALSSLFFKSYINNRNKKSKENVIKTVNMEMQSIDEKIKKNNEIKDAQNSKKIDVKKAKKAETKRQKKLNEKKLKTEKY